MGYHIYLRRGDSTPLFLYLKTLKKEEVSPDVERIEKEFGEELTIDIVKCMMLLFLSGGVLLAFVSNARAAKLLGRKLGRLEQIVPLSGGILCIVAAMIILALIWQVFQLFKAVESHFLSRGLIKSPLSVHIILQPGVILLSFALSCLFILLFNYPIFWKAAKGGYSWREAFIFGSLLWRKTDKDSKKYEGR